MNHDDAVRDWKLNAKRRDEANYMFLHKLKFPPRGVKPDKLAAALHEEAFKVVDCTRCANCCKTLNIEFKHEDVGRIAAQLGIERAELIDRYLKPAKDPYYAEFPQRAESEPREETPPKEPESYFAKARPCPFLGADDRCTIYEIRPTVCREYPHTDEPDFATRTMPHAENAVACPAVYYVVERMRERVREIRENRRRW